MNQDQVLGLMRHVLTITGGFLVAQGFLTDGALTEIVGGILAATGSVWSWWDKK